MSEEVHEDRHEGENSKDDGESSFFVSGSSTDFTPALVSVVRILWRVLVLGAGHTLSSLISRERALNRTNRKYVASFKVYFRTSISEKSNLGE
jgi:hypothetical protein